MTHEPKGSGMAPDAGELDAVDTGTAGGSVVVDREPGEDRKADSEAGMATAEYAIATLAAVGLAGLLIVILKGDMVKGLLEGIISTALSVG